MPERRLIAPSSASMNSSAFFSAASEMPDGSAAVADLAPSVIVPHTRLIAGGTRQSPAQASIAAASGIPGERLDNTGEFPAEPDVNPTARYASPVGFLPSAAWAAASRAIGTRNGEHDT